MSKIKVVKKNDYFTVVATDIILKGEFILKLQGAVSDIPNKYSLQIDKDKHLLPFSENPEDESSIFRFLNHSCNPNSYFDIENMLLIALRNINKNEEVVFHYCTTEYDMAFPFTCLCKTPNCLSEIKGFKYLSDTKKQELSLQLAPHLKIIE